MVRSESSLVSRIWTSIFRAPQYCFRCLLRTDSANNSKPSRRRAGSHMWTILSCARSWHQVKINWQKYHYIWRPKPARIQLHIRILLLSQLSHCNQFYRVSREQVLRRLLYSWNRLGAREHSFTKRVSRIEVLRNPANSGKSSKRSTRQ